jgi:putative FmdB family regulatory protein
MPIYEYECKACGERFDKLIRNVEKPPKIVCPSCEGLDVQRLISQVAVHGAEGGSMDAEIAEAAAETESSKPPVFGRKELKAAQEKKQQWREQAKYGD